MGGSGAAACIVSYPSPADAGGRPFGVTAGPGGTWYSDGNTLNRIHDGSTTTYTVAGVDASDTVGLGWLTWDGKDTIWFAAGADGRIGTITGDGTITTIQVPEGTDGPAVVQGFVLHPGRDLWFSDQLNNRIGDYSLTTDGFHLRRGPRLPGPQSLAEGRDGDLYFVERPVDKVGRLDPRDRPVHRMVAARPGSIPRTGSSRPRTAPSGSPRCWATTWAGSRTDTWPRIPRSTGGRWGSPTTRGISWTALYSGGGLAELSLARHGDPHLEHPGRQPAAGGRQPRQVRTASACCRAGAWIRAVNRVPLHSLTDSRR